ncbi:uncharacterized protein LOC125946027 [Dermacentor silvarum]|uniref:uncharacterized protein LOC125946027 n=1 Tax=Dermacentor silvarum TaxID=543639 RepID=UPI00210068AE|nr:uncharacterized protein LOC125946027 [Dermacentor silvarum]
MRWNTVQIIVVLNMAPCFAVKYDCSAKSQSCPSTDFRCVDKSCASCEDSDFVWKCHVKYKHDGERRCTRYRQCVHGLLDSKQCFPFLKRNKRLRLVGMSDKLYFGSPIKCMNTLYDWSSQDVVAHTVHYQQQIHNAGKKWVRRRFELKLRNYGSKQSVHLVFKRHQPSTLQTDFPRTYCTADCLIMGYIHPFQEEHKMPCMVWSWERNITKLSLQCTFIIKLYCMPLIHGILQGHDLCL